MHESERNRLAKEQRALLLASSDMEQAAAAARALENEHDGTLARALETAMAVCYMRPFTKSDLAVPDEYVPTTGVDEAAHSHLKALRNKVYAHTDKYGGAQPCDLANDTLVHLRRVEEFAAVRAFADAPEVVVFGRPAAHSWSRAEE